MPTVNYSSKVALVTGASSGMGFDFVMALLKEGYVVYAAARRVERMAPLEAQGAILIRMDITQEDQIQAAVDQITSKHGALDVLINNAGFGLYGAVEDTSIDDARYQFEVNLFGLARCLTQLLLPAMRERRRGKSSIFHPWVVRFIRPWGPGITPPNMHWKAGQIVCAWS